MGNNGSLPDIIVDINFEQLFSEEVDVLKWVGLPGRLFRGTTQRGRSHELQRFEAGSATIDLYNPDRALEPDYGGSPYFPDVKANRRLRLGIRDGQYSEQCMNLDGTAGSFAVTSGSLTVWPVTRTTTIYEMKVKPASWTPAGVGLIFGRWNTGAQVFRITILPSGDLVYEFRDGAPSIQTATATASVAGFSTTAPTWLRVVHRENVSGNWEVDFFYSSDGLTYTKLGATVTGVANGITTGEAAQYTAGAQDDDLVRFIGCIYYCSLNFIFTSAPTVEVEYMRMDFEDPSLWRAGDTVSKTSSPDITFIFTLTIGGTAVILGAPYNIFHGLIDSWTELYDRNNRLPYVRIRARDAFKMLAKDRRTANIVAQTSDVRVTTVLDLVGWPTGLRLISSGGLSLQATDISRLDVLSHLHHVAVSEFGRMFLDASGRFVFQVRNEPFSSPISTPIGTLTQFDYKSLGDPESSDSQIWNDVTIGRAGGTPQSATDAPSQAEFGNNSMDRTGLLLADDAAALLLAQFLLSLYKDQKKRIPSLVVDPRHDPLVLYPLVLSADLGEKINVEYLPPAGGATIIKSEFIEGITWRFDIQSQDFSVTYQLSPTDTQFAELDDPDTAVLDETAILGI